MKIIHVVSGLGAASGVTTFVENVVAELRKHGEEVIVETKPNLPSNEKDGKCDIIHINGLWDPWLHRWAAFARKRKVPVVWSTHGMTAPWSMAHKRWKKLIPWYLYQRRDLAKAAMLHVTTEQEAEWNRELGFRNRQVVAPLGVNVGNRVETCRMGENGINHGIHGKEGLGVSGGVLQVLFVGRVYPVKGLMNVVKAAALLKGEKIKFRIVGPDQAGHMGKLKAEAERLGVTDMFDWAGPKYGEELSREYDYCDLLILPSFTENFGATVIDALAHGRPALASKQTPWWILEERGCGWWVDNSPETLAKSLKEILRTTLEELQQMGERGKRLVEEKYTWDVVCDAMLSAYVSMLSDTGTRA